jgi:hypothetical protein
MSSDASLRGKKKTDHAEGVGKNLGEHNTKRIIENQLLRGIAIFIYQTRYETDDIQKIEHCKIFSITQKYFLF